MVSVRPFDPRLLRYARSARTPIALTALLGTVTALLVLAQALLISAALSPVVSGSATLTGILPVIAGVAAVFALRAMVVAGREAIAACAATNAIIELRKRVINASIALGPRWRATNSAQTATLLSPGLEDLRPYFVSFLPQLVLVCTVTPAALGVILLLDFWSALIALLVLPLIPIFMILIGRFTEAASQDKLETMKRLTAQLLDLMSGLPTLRALGREKAPRAHLRALGKANTKATMATLRVAFLSGAVLEFLTTLSVALVAVEVGMRLVFGNISLFHGLAVIMLAPEVFEPLRQVGAQFHASANGVAASRAAFDIIEQADDTAHPGTTACPDMSATDIVLNGVEMGGGSVRIHQSDIQSKMFEVLGFTPERAGEQFGFLLEAFKYGVPPHAGLAYGMDRMVMLMVGADSIRDVIAFPKIKDASCLMMEAPSEVDPKQLEELGIEIAQKKED